MGLGWGLGGTCPYLLGSDGLLAGLVKLLNGLLVVTEILLATNEDDREAAAEVNDFRDPLVGTCQRFLISKMRARGTGGIIPSPGRCRASRGSRQQSRSG